VTSHARTPSGVPEGFAEISATTVLEAADVARIVDRMAHQIIENIARGTSADAPDRGFDAVLMGIPTRGVPLAQRLAARIACFENVQIPVGSLDITL
jgi:pyrimidine operon attenuation protein / uracil phosphoribosyltransferase